MNMMRRWGLLLGVLLAGCASSGPSSATFQEAEREEADACLALLCDEALCGFFRCEDVAEAMAVSEGAEVAPGGVVDRSQVARHAFADPAERAWLEGELWPRVGRRVRVARSRPSRTASGRRRRRPRNTERDFLPGLLTLRSTRTISL